MSGWDDEDYEPPAAAIPSVPKDKWEGEDSDDDNIKAAWDQESDEEKPKVEQTEEERDRAVQKKKKKKLADIIAAKEEARLAELEEIAKRRAELDQLNTPEAKQEAKLRLQKMEENANLELAKEMMGLKVAGSGIDGMFPETKDQFDELEKAIGDKLQSLVGQENYPEFAEKLVKRICLDMNVASLKKVKLQVEALHSAKLKDEKAAKSKKPGKGGRTTVKMDLDKDLLSGGVGDYDDMDDFM